MYTPFAPYKYNEATEVKVLNINRRFASDFARVHGLKTKLDGFTRKFYIGDTFVGMVNPYPSNNGKFYAVNKNHEDGLFFTFEEAIKFATN